jgi:AcrR family transcriptional regulator
MDGETQSTAISLRAGDTSSPAVLCSAKQVRRAMILEAMVSVVCEHGFARASVRSVCARAGVSRRSFYELFDSREACFLALTTATTAPAPS